MKHLTLWALLLAPFFTTATDTTMKRVVSFQRTFYLKVPNTRTGIGDTTIKRVGYFSRTFYITLPNNTTTGGIVFTNTTSFSTALSWDTVANAVTYRVYKNGNYLTELTSTDTWDWNEGTAAYSVQALSNTGTVLATLAGTCTAAPRPQAVNIAGDYRQLTVSVSGTTITGNFTAADAGKCISIAAAANKPWYRSAPLWWHGFIASAGTGWAIVRDSTTPGGKYLGDPLSTLTNTSNRLAYVATNHAATLRTAIASGAQYITTTGTAYIDPFRDSQYVATTLASQNNPELLHINSANPILINGTFVVGEEDQPGQELSSLNRYSGTNVNGHTHYYALALIRHYRGTLGLQGNWRGPMTIPIRNQSNYHTAYLYKRDINSAYNVELHMNGIFGDTTNYQSGFVNLAENTAGYATSGKEVVAVYGSKLAASEAFSVRPWYSDSVARNYNKRFLARSTTVYGTAYRKMGAQARGRIVGDVLIIDSTSYPNFSFYEMDNYPGNQYVIMKRKGDPQGALNAYENAFARCYTAATPYRALLTNGSDNYGMHTRPLVEGDTLDLVLDTEMHRGIPSAGHWIYPQAAMEIELDGITFTNYNAKLLRASDAPTTRGRNWQFGANNITSSPTNTSFDFVRAFGGYAQWSPTPGVGFGGNPFAEAQGGAGLTYGVARNAAVIWNIQNITLLQ